MQVEPHPILPLPIRAVPVRIRPMWRKVLRLLVGWTLGLTTTCLVFTGMVWLGLHWFILPHIDQWRSEIETLATRVVGVPVRLGAIHVQTQGWTPTVVLTDVVLTDTNHRPALVLPKVLASLSPRSVLALEPRFRQLVIDRPLIEIERDAQGQWRVAGLLLQPDASQSRSPGLNWLLRQSEVLIREGRILWSDQLSPSPPLLLSDVTFLLRNGLRDHAIRLDVSPPALWGQRVSLRARMTQSLLAPASDWKLWSGTVYGEMPNSSLQMWAAHFKLPVPLLKGHGALRAWIELEAGQPVVATLDVALSEVTTQWVPELEPLFLERMQGRIQGVRRGNNTRIQLSQLSFTTPQGLSGPQGNITLGWKQNNQGGWVGGELSAERLDLQKVSHLARYMPFTAPVQLALEQAQAQGTVEGFVFGWEGHWAAPSRYKLKGNLQNFELQPRQGTSPASTPGEVDLSGPQPQTRGRPGIRGATLAINATERGGQAQVKVVQGALTWPGLWEQPVVPLARLDAQVLWRIEPAQNALTPKLSVELVRAELSNDDFEGSARANWTRWPAAPGHANPGILDLQAQVQRARADRVERYLPSGLSVRRYLAGALQGGQLADGQIRVRGDLKDFPFPTPSHSASVQAPKNEFHISTRVEKLQLKLVPDEPPQDNQPARASAWPQLSDVAGDFVLERGGLHLRNVSASYGDVRLSKIQASIQKFGPHAVLELQAKGAGPLQDFVRFIHESPVAGWTSNATSTVQAQGAALLQLSLNLPLVNAKAATIKGSLELAGNQLQWSPEVPGITQLTGVIDFTHNSLSLRALEGQLLGGKTLIQGGVGSESGFKLEARGRVSAEGLRQASVWPAVARAAQALQGETAYHLDLSFVHGLPKITLTSSAEGMAFELPAPLRKAPEGVWPIRLQTVPIPPGLGQGRAVSDTLRITLGPYFQGVYLRDHSGSGPRVTQGTLVVGQGLVSAVPHQADARPSVTAQVHLPSLDLDAWRRWAGVLNTANPAQPPEQLSATGGYFPTRWNLHADELVVASRKFTQVKAYVQSEGPLLRVQMDADQFSGMVSHVPGPLSPSGHLVVRLKRLNLQASDPLQGLIFPAQSQPSPLLSSADLPNLDIVIDDFSWRNIALGRLELEASSAASDGQQPRAWTLTRGLLDTPDARLSATAQTQAERVVLDFKLELIDSGLLSQRLGLEGTIRGGKGAMGGQLTWPNAASIIPPLSQLSGQLNLALQSGQFLKAQPGAARLLGVLSLQSLPRRLVLDFRDVFQEGFAFDSLTGDVQLAQGVATTNNLRMLGVQAAVLMEGQAHLLNETQDLRVVVVPEINAGTASLAYAVINPAIGVGSFLAQLFLRTPLMKASTRAFVVQGSWSDPQVTRVDQIPNSNAAAEASQSPPQSP